MKKLLIFLFFIPLLSFSQISSWRNSIPRQSYSSPAPRSYSGLDNNVSRWRNESPREFNRPQPTKPGSNIIVTQPYSNWNWGWGSWGMWGAPMYGFNYYSPYWYIGPYGYRQPARVYVYDNGKKDTIFGKKPIINFGISKTSNEQLGAFFAIGNKGYFIMDFVTTYKPDNSTYFPYGTLSQVDFPLKSDLKKQRTIYLGGGKRFGRTGVHGMIGFGSENVYYRGYDRYGDITFPKYEHNFTTFKVGILHDFKHFTLKVDGDPIKDYIQFGLGLNF